MAGSSLTPEELAALRRSDPDPIGLMDVMELIAPDARVTGWKALPGGVANIMHRIDVTMPSGSEVAFVLRRAIPELGWEPDLAHTAQTLESLRPTPVQAPELLWMDTDGAVFGRPALAMTRLPGRPRSHVRNLLRESAADLGPTEVALCHGDFHIGNVLFDGPHPTGIVDWDSALLADSRMDLAYAAMDLAIFGGLDLADTFLDAYEALRGPIADRDWWFLRATAATWDDVASWLPGWHDLGIDIGLDEVHARLRQWTDRHLAGLRG